jgi:hypothetical protein
MLIYKHNEGASVMQKMVVRGTVPAKKRRAIELFSQEFNFRSKTVGNKKAYRRREKHRKNFD